MHWYLRKLNWRTTDHAQSARLSQRREVLKLQPSKLCFPFASTSALWNLPRAPVGGAPSSLQVGRCLIQINLCSNRLLKILMCLSLFFNTRKELEMFKVTTEPFLVQRSLAFTDSSHTLYLLYSPHCSIGLPHLIALCRSCVFHKLNICGNFHQASLLVPFVPTAFGHFMSLHHILLTVGIFQTISLLLCLLWWSVCDRWSLMLLLWLF